MGHCPVFDTIDGDGLCPKIPLKYDGIRIDPPISEPTPNGDPAAAYRSPKENVQNLKTNVT